MIITILLFKETIIRPFSSNIVVQSLRDYLLERVIRPKSKSGSNSRLGPLNKGHLHGTADKEAKREEKNAGYQSKRGEVVLYL